MTQFLDLMIESDYDLQISEVMNELSYNVSARKGWPIIDRSAKKLVHLEHKCDWERNRIGPRLAYGSLYEAWWKIRNMREKLVYLKNIRMDIEMESVVGGGN